MSIPEESPYSRYISNILLTIRSVAATFPKILTDKKINDPALKRSITISLVILPFALIILIIFLVHVSIAFVRKDVTLDPYYYGNIMCFIIFSLMALFVIIIVRSDSTVNKLRLEENMRTVSRAKLSEHDSKIS